jgi:hypothetical protein
MLSVELRPAGSNQSIAAEYSNDFTCSPPTRHGLRSDMATRRKTIPAGIVSFLRSQQIGWLAACVGGR